ncbi:hypothetical protein BDM02DRAFT_3187924 [Thelephora ganbajun]|uniref:Uncharacterized protein n=1 Tax=Thelephora ganbajun TaxID=370292 RepID=A0ACB6ZD48_THEGA|nr:hypothetical protein BDM02DRAFT_3187924 [Thelephora ganbajun]
MTFSAMISDLVVDATLQAHYEAQKLNVLCDMCHTRLVLGDEVVAQVRCALRLPRFTYRPAYSHSVRASTSTGSTDPSSPRPPSPSVEGKQSTPTGSASGASTGPTNGKSDGAIYFECLNCKRQIASNRYAPHLSSCMGVGNGNRRGGSRNPITKSKSGVDQGRSESPYLGSEASDDSKPSTKGKNDGDFSIHRKRPGSPQATPKKLKKAKTTGKFTIEECHRYATSGIQEVFKIERKLHHPGKL